jgi:hypothetical protein
MVVPDWYANGCCRVLALVQTLYSMVYLVIKIIKVHKLQVSEKCIQAIELNRTGTLPPTEIFLTSRKR